MMTFEMYQLCFSVQSWLEAIEDHSAYSTHYCTQEQLSSDDEEDDTVSVTDLQETLKVCTKYFMYLGSCTVLCRDTSMYFWPKIMVLPFQGCVNSACICIAYCDIFLFGLCIK